LNSEQRRAFETWRAVGLSESAAMNALIEDGVITLSEDEHLARRFRTLLACPRKPPRLPLLAVRVPRTARCRRLLGGRRQDRSLGITIV
jgi:hypothetical protein